MSVIKTIPIVKNLIAKATDNISGEVFWEGEKGEKVILESLADIVCDRGLMRFDNVTAMSNAGGADAGWALCKVDGANCLYAFYPNVDTGAINAVLANGGQWRLMIAGDNNRKRYRVLADTSIALGFGIAHNLGYDFPSVRCIRSETDFSIPRKPIEPQDIFYVDNNNLTVGFGAGDANKLITIIIEI